MPEPKPSQLQQPTIEIVLEYAISHCQVGNNTISFIGDRIFDTICISQEDRPRNTLEFATWHSL